MPILNRDRYPYLNSNNIEYRDDTYAFQLRNWDDAKYFYVEFLIGASLSINLDSWIPPFYQNLIRGESNTYLVLNNSHEAFHSVVEAIYKFIIIEGKIPANKIILISESADVHEVVKTVAVQNNLPCINVEWVMMFKAGVKQQRSFQISDPTYKNFNTLEIKSYPKRYLNFNRRWRMHRPSLVALLVAYGILDQGHVSLGKSDCGTEWPHTFNWIKQRLSSDQYLLDKLTAHEQKILSLPSLYLDTENLRDNRADLETTTDSFYSSSLVSVVSETNFFPEFEVGRFLSEKTWKPVAYKHPFIMVSVPRTMKLLRQLGYKTFHPYINEEYDGETDPVRRLRLIVEELERICNFTDNKLLDFIEGVRPKVEHNFNLLMNTDSFITKTL